MKRHCARSTAFFIARARVGVMVVCCLLFLVATQAWAQDPCAGAPAPCGVTITIGGAPGSLTATISGGGEGSSYDNADDEIVGIINGSTATVGAIRLSSPPLAEDSLFEFDGDGPACYDFVKKETRLGCQVMDPTDYDGPNNTYVGVSPDFTTGTIRFTTPIAPMGTTWFALENTPVTVVSIGETQTLKTGVTNIFKFGPFTLSNGTWTENSNAGDDFQFTPVSQLTSTAQNPDLWTFLPIPVCAGPLGIGDNMGFGFGAGEYGLEIPLGCAAYTEPPSGPPGFNSPAFPTLACVAYSDYSSLNNPVCVELERDCSGPDCGTVQWTARLDYDLDADSIANAVGGPAVLFAPGVAGPTTPTPASEDPYNQVMTDFSINALTAYTGACPGNPPSCPDPPPAKAGGSDGKSVFVSAFSPTQSESSPVPPGVTVGFPGFEAPISNTLSPSCSAEPGQYLLFPSGKQVTVNGLPVNCLVRLLGLNVPVPLVWDYTTTSNVPITNLQLCKSLNANGTCATPHVAPPWVYISLAPVANCGAFAGQNPLPGIFVPNVLTLPGQYSFTFTPVNNPKGCSVSPVLQFNNGTTTTVASPAVLVYNY